MLSDRKWDLCSWVRTLARLHMVMIKSPGDKRKSCRYIPLIFVLYPKNLSDISHPGKSWSYILEILQIYPIYLAHISPLRKNHKPRKSGWQGKFLEAISVMKIFGGDKCYEKWNGFRLEMGFMLLEFEHFCDWKY